MTLHCSSHNDVTGSSNLEVAGSTLNKSFTHVPLFKQYKLVPAKGGNALID